MTQEQIEQAAEAILDKHVGNLIPAGRVYKKLIEAMVEFKQAGAALTAPSAGVWVKASNPPAKATYVEGRNINGSNRGVKLEWDGENWFILYRGSECKIPKNEVKYYEWYNDESRSASQPDLKAIESNIDDLLDGETTESLTTWLLSQPAVPSAGVWRDGSTSPSKPMTHYFCYLENEITGAIFKALAYRTGVESWDTSHPFKVLRYLDQSPSLPPDGVQGLVEALEKALPMLEKRRAETTGLGMPVLILKQALLDHQTLNP